MAMTAYIYCKGFSDNINRLDTKNHLKTHYQMDQVATVKSAYKKLESQVENYHLMAGFDGFVDEIIHVVDKREDMNRFKRIETIEAFSKRIASYSGLSGNIELVPTQIKLGGNGPIYANMLLAQGHQVVYMGALGDGEVHPVFREFSDACEQVITMADPGHTDALEFLDGKLMLGKMNKLEDVSWGKLLTFIQQPELEKLLKKSKLVACNNWTMLSKLNSILLGFDSLFENMKQKPDLFIDLADPAKRTGDDIAIVLEILSRMHTNVILSMNLNESSIIASVLGIVEKDVVERAVKIRSQLGLAAIVIHPVEGAAVSTKNESAWVQGPYTPSPKLTTGAGDNFNAGFSHGWMYGLKPSECCATGVCTSGYYVRNGGSPNKEQLISFMKDWADAGCGNI